MSRTSVVSPAVVRVSRVSLSASCSSSAQSRTLRLREALQRVLDLSLRDASISEFKACFEPAGDVYNDDEIADIHSQLLVQLRKNISDEFAQICSECGLREKLERLDELLHQQGQMSSGRRRPAPATVQPDDEIRDMRVAHKELEKKRLQEALAEVEQENKKRRRILEEQRARVAKLADELQERARDLDKAAEIAEEFNEEFVSSGGLHASPSPVS
eukprot:tig00000865_g5091.t1